MKLKKNILSHPVTSKQPHKTVQIHMRHPVHVYILKSIQSLNFSLGIQNKLCLYNVNVNLIIFCFVFQQKWMEMKPQYSLNELKKMYKSQRPKKQNKKSVSNELLSGDHSKSNKNNVKSKWIEFQEQR